MNNEYTALIKKLVIDHLRECARASRKLFASTPLDPSVANELVDQLCVNAQLFQGKLRKFQALENATNLMLINKARTKVRTADVPPDMGFVCPVCFEHLAHSYSVCATCFATRVDEPETPDERKRRLGDKLYEDPNDHIPQN